MNNTDDVSPDIKFLKATNITLEDVANNGNPSDIQVSFTGAEMNEIVSSYYLIYSPANSPLVDPPLFTALQPSNTTQITPQQPKDNIHLGETQVSFDNQPFDRTLDYLVYVVSVSSFDNEQIIALSDPSETFNLSASSPIDPADYLATQIEVQAPTNNGDASDIIINFNGGSNMSSIQAYRVFVAKAETQVEVSVAQALEIGQYTTLDTIREAYSVSLDPAQRDYTGDPIQTGQAYKAYVMTIGTFNGGPVTLLSEASSEFELVHYPEVSTLVSGVLANDAITMDQVGNLYICNYGSYNPNTYSGTGSTVVKVTPEGEQSTFITGLIGPVGGAIDMNGNFYVNSGSNAVSGDLIKIDSEGNKSTITTIKGYPSGILIDEDNSLYIANYYGSAITKVTSDGTISEFANDPALVGGVGITFDDNGNILVGNLVTGDILSVSSDGSDISLIATIPTVISQYVIGYITFFEGYIYATGLGANKIYRVSLDGQIEEFAGNGQNASIDGVLSQASFSVPNGITVDREKRVLYISEISGNLRVIPID